MATRSPQVHANPAVLRWARETAGWPLDEISSKLDVDVATYKKWESGELPTRLTTLEELADYFKRPVAAFFLPQPPEEPSPPSDFRFLPKKRGQFDRKTLLAIRRVQRMQSVARNLMENLHRAFTPEIGTAIASNDPETVARRERDPLGVTLDDQESWETVGEAFERWRQAIEMKNILVFRLAMPVDDARGFSLGTDTPFAIVVSASDAPVARIFTLLHEYGHLLLKTPGVCIPQVRRIRGDPATHVEQWCNRFAASFLVPKDCFEPGVDWKPITESSQELGDFLGSMSKKLKVSRQVILRRMRDLELISQKRYNVEMKKLVASVKKRKPTGFAPRDKKCLAENGRLLTSLVLESRQRGFVTTRDVSDYLSVPIKYLDGVQALVAA